MRLALLIVAAALLAGCVNAFEKFYTPDPNAQAILKMPATLPPPKTPQVFAHSNDINADAKRMAEDGYVYIGNSSFYGPANRSNQSQAIAQGEKVGAAVVLFKTDYMDTQSGVIPYTVANPPVVSTISTSGTVNTYGSGGYGIGNYNSTGTITTPGGYSTYAIPYTVNRNTFFASYWVKQDTNKMRLGVRYAPLTDELRLRLERNTGVLVQIVIRGTPAFGANFLEGDVLLRIGGADIVDVAGFSTQLAQFAGRTVVIELIRGGQSRSITVTLNL